MPSWRKQENSTEFQGEFPEIRKARVAAVKEIIAANQVPTFDTILLDEAQDYLIDELKVVRSLCNDFFLVADSRQQIYGGSVEFAHLSELVSETYTLPFHYRSGPPICQVADAIGSRFVGRQYEPILPTCNYKKDKPPSNVDQISATLEEQCEEIKKRLTIQVRAYSDEMLAVIAPRLEEVRCLADYLQQTDLRDALCVQTSEDGYQPLG